MSARLAISVFACALAWLGSGCERDAGQPAATGDGGPGPAAEAAGAAPRRGAGPFGAVTPPQAPAEIDSIGSPPARARPNLIVISIDTLRADRLGAYGCERPTSPNIDAFAAESVLFERAFSQSPITAPSHATLFTSLYPEAHRVENMFGEGMRTGSQVLDPAIPTLAEMLRAAGYATSARVAGGNVAPQIGFAHGFDAYVVHDGWRALQQFQAASQELARLAEGDRPFFLFVHTYEVHAPYLPLPRYREQFVDPDYGGEIIGDAELLDRLVGSDYSARHRAYFARVDRNSAADRRHLRDLYDASIRFTDDSVAVLLAQLRALGIDDRTVVVLLSDHGEQFGEHGGFEHAALWQELLHVPLLLRVPEAVRPGWSGRRVAEPVGLVDVAPTILELLDLPAPSHFQGRSLVARVEGTDRAPGWTFSQYRQRDDAALISGDWKWLREGRGGPPMLFDLGLDPDETMDRSPDRAAWRRIAARKTQSLLRASRAFWPLVGEGKSVRPSPEMKRQLEALGYVEAAQP